MISPFAAKIIRRCHGHSERDVPAMSPSEMKDAYKCQYADETSKMTLESREICSCSKKKSKSGFVPDAIKNLQIKKKL